MGMIRCSIIHQIVTNDYLEEFREREPQAIFKEDKLHVITVEEEEYKYNSLVYVTDYHYWKNKEAEDKVYCLINVFLKNKEVSSWLN